MNDANSAPRKPARKTPSKSKGLQDYLLLIRERWLLGLIAALIIAGGFAAYALTRPPLYEATAEMMFEENAERVLDIEAVVDTSLAGRRESILNSHHEQMTSRTFTQQVVDSFSEEEANMIVAPYRTEENPNPSLSGVFRSSAQVGHSSGSPIFRISAKHRDPKAASLIANRYADTYIDFLNQRTGNTNERAISFLNERADDLREKIEEAEMQMQQYRQEKNLVSLEENQNIIVERLKELNAALTQARVAAVETTSKLKQVEAGLEAGEDLSDIPVIGERNELQEVTNQIDQKTAAREVLKRKYLERHPKMLDNEESLTALRSLKEQIIDRTVADLRNRAQELQDREQNLEEELAAAEKEALELDRRAIEYNVLRRQLEGHRRTFDQVISRLNETNISSKMANSSVRVIDSALPPGAPYRPDKQKTALSAAFLFMLVFIGLPLSLGLIDNKLKTNWDIQTFLNKELLGEVPSVKHVPDRETEVPVLDNTNQRLTEHFRAIYSQVRLLREGRGKTATIITSTLPSEGKTFVAANLAACFAKHRRKTLVIDCDLRRPRLHETFGVKNSAGLIHWFDQNEEIPQGDAIESDPYLGIEEVGDNLHILRSGGTTRQPTELFESERFTRLFANLRDHYDQIIVDTPPAGGFPDSLVLAELADESLFIARHNHVKRDKVRFVVDRLDQTKSPVLGIVFNLTSGRVSEAYGLYKPYDEKAYRRYYGNDDQPKEEKPRAAAMSKAKASHA